MSWRARGRHRNGYLNIIAKPTPRPISWSEPQGLDGNVLTAFASRVNHDIRSTCYLCQNEPMVGAYCSLHQPAKLPEQIAPAKHHPFGGTLTRWIRRY